MGKKAEKKRLMKAKRAKSFLVFDESARKEWLTSFSKRKKERQDKAKEDLATLLKEEKARQREEFRENIKKNEAKYLEKLKDVEEILKEKTEAYKCGDKTVEITEYNLCDQEDMIGINNEEEGEEECQENEEVGSEDEKLDPELASEPPIITSRKMPKKMSKTAVRIEKRLFKLNNKRKISKHALNKKRQMSEVSGKAHTRGKKGKKAGTAKKSKH